DGDSSRLSPSRLYFTNSTGDRLYLLPYQMDAEYAEPVLLDPPSPPSADALNPLQTKESP
ncbi:MAG: hypothetical protein PHO07_07575, partial [Pirellulales bacterium]|nr:hypothetical protein [Thermoguttaceae bacterium]MDD4787014.1 hypothetical protein [Pirellulales bacterium]MDI9443043.1 hypothetical protein [Planctomycetota bacterium]NLZ02924.1 hypothetical protein [Pirellulaceae bacterium]